MNAEIITYTGKIFDLLNPKPEMVCIEDIAHSLANQCRYTGHTKFFYTVAQHCVLMADNSDLPGDPLQKLLHDAAETYISDLASPLKKLLQVEVPHLVPASVKKYIFPVREFEDKIQKVIGEALGVVLNSSAEVKRADIIMTATEIRDLMPVMPPDFNWSVDLSTTVKEYIQWWCPLRAEINFLKTYERLTKE